MHKPVTVVVLTWNGIKYTKACLESLNRIQEQSNVDFVVVDNGSQDGTVEYLKSIKWITPLFNTENLGFVGGNNVALKYIAQDHDVILLNNDTEIDDDQWVKKLQESAYRDEKIGIVGCRIRRTTGNILQHCGTYMPDYFYWGQQLGGGEKDINQYNQDIDVEGVVFACVYIKRSVINTIGYLDEDYFSYFEDTDYCLKAIVAGFRVVNCGDLTICHREHGSTDANNLKPNELFLVSQKIFLRKWVRYLDARLNMDVILDSTFSRPVGYAITSRLLALSLEDAKIRVAYEYLYGIGTVFPVVEDRNKNTGSSRIEVIKNHKPKENVPHIIYGQGDAFANVEGQYRIGYTMLETTGIPSEWARQCNLMDEVWVPSPFNAWTFRRSGVTVPIKVMPLGLIDNNYFNPKIKGYPIKEIYTFLSIFEWGERKAPETLLKAFNNAFRYDEPVVLVCKYSNSDPGVSPQQIIDSLQLDPRGGRIVFSENEYLPYYQISQLYRSVDCFVLPTRGEGWGMPILEAMSCGLPVIASYWSAQQYFMTDANSYPLQVQLVDAVAKCPYYKGFLWAEPDEFHLKNLLRHVYENPEEARQKGARAARDVSEKWSLPVTGKRMRLRLEEIEKERIFKEVPSSEVSPTKRFMPYRIAIDVSRVVGNEVTGVGRYTASLLAGLTHLTLVENPMDYILLPGFGGFVHPEYKKTLDLNYDKDDRFTLYRGPLPAFENADHYVPGVDLVYCTANSYPETIDTASAMVVYDITFATHPQFHTYENIELCQRNFERAIKTDCHFVAISNNTRDDFIAYYNVDPTRVSVAYCGVDDHVFSPRSELEKTIVSKKYGLPKRFFLYVGSLEPRKNLDSAIRAMAEYDGDEVLVVVGAGGWMNSGLHELIKQQSKNVKFLGYVPQGDLPALYSAAVATIYPSLYEGFGFPVVESMACGTPVVTSNNSSLAEIGKGATLLLEDPTDIKEIAATLSSLISDSSIYSALVANGIERAKLFTPERCAYATVDVFRSIQKKKGWGVDKFENHYGA
ncbi:MAG TPA: glycosyltransferase [bacterium]|nr:glycosyltransferase [bacterium]